MSLTEVLTQETAFSPTDSQGCPVLIPKIGILRPMPDVGSQLFSIATLSFTWPCMDNVQVPEAGLLKVQS